MYRLRHYRGKRCRQGEIITIAKKLPQLAIKRDKIGRRLKYDCAHSLMGSIIRTEQRCSVSIIASGVILCTFSVDPMELPFGDTFVTVPEVFSSLPYPVLLNNSDTLQASVDFEMRHGIAYVSVIIATLERIQRHRRYDLNRCP